MTQKFDFGLHVTPACMIRYHEDETGYIVWLAGTGGNVELRHLKVYELGRGNGVKLLRHMLRALLPKPPFATVYGFCRTPNFTGRKFYEKVGFVLTKVEGVYADGTAYLFSQTFDRLKELHLDQEHS